MGWSKLPDDGEHSIRFADSQRMLRHLYDVAEKYATADLSATDAFQ